MRRGAYPMDLTRQIKVRIDEITFEKITQLSEQKETTKSWIVRDIIVRSLLKTVPFEM
jgi:predicted DNA-binding protein